jgi:hypothetical protein
MDLIVNQFYCSVNRTFEMGQMPVPAGYTARRFKPGKAGLIDWKHTSHE